MDAPPPPLPPGNPTRLRPRKSNSLQGEDNTQKLSEEEKSILNILKRLERLESLDTPSVLESSRQKYGNLNAPSPLGSLKYKKTKKRKKKKQTKRKKRDLRGGSVKRGAEGQGGYVQKRDG